MALKRGRTAMSNIKYKIKTLKKARPSSFRGPEHKARQIEQAESRKKFLARNPKSGNRVSSKKIKTRKAVNKGLSKRRIKHNDQSAARAMGRIDAKIRKSSEGNPHYTRQRTK